MSKELDALERLTDDVLDKRHYYKQFISSTPHILEDKNLIEKSLKALEIIKTKKVDTEKLWLVENAYAYNNFGKVHVIPLTEEEFNLIKGVL